MKRTLVFFIAVLIPGIQNASGQNYLNYYETINKAEIAHLDGNFKKSDSLYQIAFKQAEKPFKEDYLLASINSEKLQDFQKTYEYLIKGISNGLTLKRIKNQLSYFKKSKEYKELKKEYNSLREKHLKTLNLPLRKEISEMIKKDQRVRIPILGSRKQIMKTDSDNYKRLLEIIKQNNNKWPGFSTIGEITPKGKYDVEDNIAIMLLHFCPEQIENLKPFMIQAVLDGEMYPYHLARAIDYKYLMVHGCQFYGTYIYNPKIKSTAICDCKKAEIERKKIGFEPIKDYDRKADFDYECIGNK